MLFLSIHPRFVEKILAGEKTVELRRRRPRSVAGDLIAVYASTPERRLCGIVQIEEVRVGGVRDMWPQVGKQAGVTKEEYESYFCGCKKTVAIVLMNPSSLVEPVSLDQLRKAWPNFHPPQGFRYLEDEQVRFVKSLSPRWMKTAA
ncbi:MAG: ASCH domain-containing protein [Candidatus Paceibacterota bacterium]